MYINQRLFIIFILIVKIASIQIILGNNCLFCNYKYISSFHPSHDTLTFWPKIYGGDLSTWGEDVDETYDNGYLIGGNVLNNTGVHKMGILIKTDVNGNILWEKRIGNPNYYFSFASASITSDGGVILIGSTTELDIQYDAVIMKLDACANLEWCKIFSFPNDLEDGISILQLPSGGYLAQVNYFGTDNVYKRVWLLRLDPGGNVIWQKEYGSEHPELAHSWGVDLMVASDGSFLISGTTTIEDPIGSGNWWWEPLLVKTDTNGAEIFVKAFKYDKDIFYGLGYLMAEDVQGNFLVTSKNYYNPAQNNSPGAVVKFTSSGVGLNWFNLWAPPIWGGTASTINYISADNMIVAGDYVAGFDSTYAMAYILDSTGQTLKDKVLHFTPDGNVVNETILTSDQFALMTAGFYNGPVAKGDMYLFKMDYNLEYAPFDPRILNYDSLCPSLPIVSDTIVPDCDVIVGLEEVFADPTKNRLKIYPTPTDQQITIKLPEIWLSEYQGSGITAKTAYYTFPTPLSITIFNGFGQRMFETTIADPKTITTIDVSQWSPGMYFIMITNNNKVILDDKFIVY